MKPENNINLENASIWVNGKELGNIKDFKIVGIDMAQDEDRTTINPFKSISGSIEMKFKKKYKHIIHKIYQEQGLDKAYNKYLKRVRNRKKLYEKLRKVGR